MYKVFINDMKFLDIRNTTNLRKILPGFKLKLIELKASIRPSGNGFLDKSVQDMLDQRIRLIDEDKVNNTNIRDVTMGVGDAFTEYVQSMGYKGVVAYEGGEDNNLFLEDHDTWVVFDPNRIDIVQEQEIIG
jgi:hypothetical protein